MAAITIDDLRGDWTQQVAEYDRMIALLEAEKKVGLINDDLDPPHHAWVELLHDWRAELVELLGEYPGTPDA